MVEETADPANGKEIFQQTCGGCHTLREAGTNGSNPVQNPSSGPNLDDAFAASREEGFAADTIAEVVRGQIDYPVPPMPEDLPERCRRRRRRALCPLVAANPDASIGGGPARAATTRSRCSRATVARAMCWRRRGPRAPSARTSTRRSRRSRRPSGRSRTGRRHAGLRRTAHGRADPRPGPLRLRGRLTSFPAERAKPVPRRFPGARLPAFQPRLPGRPRRG